MTHIVVHHLNQSRSHRILWVLEELGLAYEIRAWQRDPTTRLAPPELRDIHPLGKAPVLELDGTVLAESGAIVEALTDRFGVGTLTPDPGTPDFLRYKYWLHYAEGTLMPPLVMKLILTVTGTQSPAVAYVDHQITLNLDYLEGSLIYRPHFVAGRFTAADAMMYFPVQAAIGRRPAGSKSYPNLKSFTENMEARPAFHRATAKGGL